jgi:hypothetical protein
MNLGVKSLDEYANWWKLKIQTSCDVRFGFSGVSWGVG